tara:strand:+ start:99 stop:803 length:705 start_codon:yes stop_codon:yes gene_type:complete
MSVDALQDKMHSALDFDQKKTQLNDAKLRAVAQKVEYEEFEKMVAGAHLKPVKPCSQESAGISKQFGGFVMPAYQPTQPSAAAAATSAAAAAAVSATKAETFAQPKSSNDFLRTWRRQCKTPDAKYQYLRVIEPEQLPLLFRSEMEPAVLDGIAEALRSCALVDGSDAEPLPEAAWLERLLQFLCRINRFELTLDLADKATGPALAACFDALQQRGGGQLDEAGLRAVRESYKL